jgi:hypothetical protein
MVRALTATSLSCCLLRPNPAVNTDAPVLGSAYAGRRRLPSFVRQPMWTSTMRLCTSVRESVKDHFKVWVLASACMALPFIPPAFAQSGNYQGSWWATSAETKSTRLMYLAHREGAIHASWSDQTSWRYSVTATPIQTEPSHFAGLLYRSGKVGVSAPAGGV